MTGILVLLGTLIAAGAGIGYAVYFWRKDREREALAHENSFRANLLQSLKKRGHAHFNFGEFVQREQASPELARRVAEEVYAKFWQKVLADSQVTDLERKQVDALARALALTGDQAHAIEHKAKEGKLHSAITAALSDGVITDAEALDLQRLRRSLGIGANQAFQATADMARDSYLALFREIASDGRISSQEIAELQRFQAALGMSANEANAVLREDALNLYRLWFTNIVQDGEVTEQEEQALRWLVKQFKLPVEDIAYYQVELQEVKCMAKIRQGQLPAVKTSKLLESGEICHWQGNCRYQWETATATKEASGELLVTSEQIAFASPIRSFTLSPSKLLDIQLFNDAIQVQTSINRGSGTYFVDNPRMLEAIIVGVVHRHKYILSENYSSSQSRHIPDSVRREVWHRDGGRCTRCGATEYLEFDHIIPHAKGGANTVNNVQLLCRRCNNRKRDRI